MVHGNVGLGVDPGDRVGQIPGLAHVDDRQSHQADQGKRAQRDPHPVVFGRPVFDDVLLGEDIPDVVQPEIQGRVVQVAGDAADDPYDGRQDDRLGDGTLRQGLGVVEKGRLDFFQVERRWVLDLRLVEHVHPRQNHLVGILFQAVGAAPAVGASDAPAEAVRRPVLKAPPVAGRGGPEGGDRFEGRLEGRHRRRLLAPFRLLFLFDVPVEGVLEHAGRSQEAPEILNARVLLGNERIVVDDLFHLRKGIPAHTEARKAAVVVVFAVVALAGVDRKQVGIFGCHDVSCFFLFFAASCVSVCV